MTYHITKTSEEVILTPWLRDRFSLWGIEKLAELRGEAAAAGDDATVRDIGKVLSGRHGKKAAHRRIRDAFPHFFDAGGDD